MTHATPHNPTLLGVISMAHEHAKREYQRYPVASGIHILRYAISTEEFRTRLQIFFEDKDIFDALMFLDEHGVNVEIAGAYGDWIFVDEKGTIRIRHDIGNLRIKEFFGIAEPK